MIDRDRENYFESAKRFREKAMELAHLVRTTRSLRQGSEARRQQKAYNALAENEEWLAGHADKLV